MLAAPILKLNLNLRNRPPEKPSYHNHIEDTTGLMDLTQFSIPKSLPS
ncbi:hypothetical protein A2U01_0115440 [Trifolium medium]|uniref:Uncharacterized protein n=1 Tax=Trifolium medium TaxID=97028 RepID=A0A392W364_9FABA|nr:hypothetical protein [Trifolium medium]